MTVKQRMKMYLDARNIATARAEKESGLPNATFAKLFNNPDSVVGMDKIEAFLNAYPELSAEWLMRGTGSMIIGEGIPTEQIFKTLNLPANSDKIIAVWMKFMECTQGMQELFRQADIRPEQNA